jgi:hypothetical protein
MKNIEEVRKICGHYWNKPEYKPQLNEHRCHHIAGNSCPNSFKDCPLYKLVQKNIIK